MPPPPITSTQPNKGIAGFLRSARIQNGFLGLLLLVATIMAYQPAWHGKPIWDDDAHLTPPELRSFQGLVRIWIEPGATQQYYPLIYSLFWVEHKLWGDATTGYHLLNILLHAFSALLLWRILRQLELPGAYWAAAVFALHPVCVESVAWISEIKNTLSGVFYLSAALVYLRFDRSRDGKFYCFALGLFLLGLMSKTVIATLPAALLVIFWWQRGRLSWKQDVMPLILFFVAGIGAGLFTAWMEWKFVGARGSAFDFTFIERVLIAGRVIWFYLGKLVWPADLIFIYPRWHISQKVGWQYVFPVGALLVPAGLWLLSRRTRGPLAAWLFFIGTLFPALGFFNVYPFRYSFVADHFQYLAMIGPIALAAAGITKLFSTLKINQPFGEPVFCGMLLIILGVLTWRQSANYANVETLWRTTIARNPDAWLATYNLGTTLAQKGGWEEAIQYLQKAVQTKPDLAVAHYNLGDVLMHSGRVDAAIDQFRKAIQFEPNQPLAHYELANALIKKGMVDEGIAQFRIALELNPNFADAHRFLGMALLYSKGQPDAAIVQFKQALKANPRCAEAYNYLGIALLQEGRQKDAAIGFQIALEMQPHYLLAQNNLAWLLATSSDATVRNGPLAVALARDADQYSNGRNPMVAMTLAAAYAEARQFPEATATVQRALKLAESQHSTGLISNLQLQLKLYQDGSPLRIPDQTNAPVQPTRP